MAESIATVYNITVDLNKPLQKTILRDLFVTEDRKAHTFTIRAERNGVQVPLTGAEVTGYFLRYKDNVSVPLSGTIKNGCASINLIRACYDIRTMFALTITVTLETETHTLFVGEGQMVLNRSDSVKDTSQIIPSLSDILAQYDALRSGVAAANTAAEAENEAAENANDAAGRAPYIGENNHWYIWDAASKQYVDSTDPSIPALTFQVRTGAAGSQVLIEQGGTPEAPVIILTIPRGDTGAVDGVDYFEGTPSSLGVASPGIANGVARGDHVHPMPDALDVGAVKMSLAWTNPSVSSEFAEQDIALTLNSSDHVLVMFRATTTAGNISAVVTAKCGQSARAFGAYFACFARRDFTVSTTGISFKDGEYFGEYGTSSSSLTASNRILIPVRIYVLKGVL